MENRLYVNSGLAVNGITYLQQKSFLCGTTSRIPAQYISQKLCDLHTDYYRNQFENKAGVNIWCSVIHTPLSDSCEKWIQRTICLWLCLVTNINTCVIPLYFNSADRFRITAIHPYDVRFSYTHIHFVSTLINISEANIESLSVPASSPDMDLGC